MVYRVIRDEVRAPGIGILTLNRPEKRNALSILMRQEISHLLSGWGESDEVGAVVLTGAGSAFSAGFDLSEFGDPERFEELFDSSSRYHRDLWRFPKPIIAAVNGPAMGGAFDLATLCDIRICNPSAAFGHPEVRFGVPPLLTPLRWIVGEGVARELALTGRTIGAEEAHRVGLVSRVVDANRLLDEALRIGEMILKAPPEALRFAKAALEESGGRGFEESFRIEHDRAFVDIVRPLVKAGFRGNAARRPLS